jgi:hypothetical protein
MILNSIEKSVKNMIFNPLTLIPMLVIVIVSAVSTEFTSFILERPLTELFLYYDTFMTSDFGFIFISRYLFEIIAAIVSGFIVLAITIMGFLAIANYAKKGEIFDAINKGFSNITKAASLAFYGIVVLFLGFVALALLQGVFDFLYSIFPDNINAILALIVFPLILLILFCTYLTKLSFVLPAAIDHNVRDAIKSSWEFTNDKFWNAFVFVLILIIICILIISIINYIGILIELDFIFGLIADLISMTFFGLGISYYYFNK